MLYGEDTTIEAIEEKQQPAVVVSLSQLKNIALGERHIVKRYDRVYYMDATERKNDAQLNPHFKVQSPYDEWKVWYENPGDYKAGDNIRPKKNVYEEWYPALLAEWLPYITTAFLQPDPGTFLEYLRLIQSAKYNPEWVEPVFYGENTPATRFKWVDILTGVEHGGIFSYPPLIMYPHTMTSDGKPDMSITVDRFKETLIYDALGQSFTIMDISRTTDPQFLEWAFQKVLNRSQYVKSQISESSIVKISRNGSVYKTVSVYLHPELREMFKRAADDVLALVRGNRDKLAARAIEVRSLQSQGVKAEFIGPSAFNPVTSSFTTDTSNIKKIDAQNNTTTQFNTSPLPPSLKNVPPEAIEEIPVPVRKNNFMLPIAGAAVAALGIYAATR